MIDALARAACDVGFMGNDRARAHQVDFSPPFMEADFTLLVPPGEKHVTRNTGKETLVLLCFFPVAEIARRTQDVAAR